MLPQVTDPYRHGRPKNADAGSARKLRRQGSKELAEQHLPYAALVGSDVCILPAAFEGFPLREGSIGWRGQVTAKRGGGLAKAQVEIFGTYFSLLDRSKILPIVQPEEEEEAEDDENGGEDEEGEEEGSDEEEGEEEADEEMEHDSSGDELPRKKSRKM